MTLCDGVDNTRRLTCPYHAWSYGLDGALRGVPQRDRFPGFDPASAGLQPLPVSEQSGLVVVGLRPDVEVEGFLDPLGDEYSWLGYDRYRSGSERTFHNAANWKLTVDLNVEAYHVPSLHRDSLLPFLADHCAVDTFGPHCRMAVPFKGIENLADVPEARVARPPRHDHGHVHLPGDGDGRPPRRRRVVAPHLARAPAGGVDRPPHRRWPGRRTMRRIGTTAKR